MQTFRTFLGVIKFCKAGFDLSRIFHSNQEFAIVRASILGRWVAPRLISETATLEFSFSKEMSAVRGHVKHLFRQATHCRRIPTRELAAGQAVFATTHWSVVVAARFAASHRGVGAVEPGGVTCIHALVTNIVGQPGSTTYTDTNAKNGLGHWRRACSPDGGWRVNPSGVRLGSILYE
jgi:hypothetical protein